jgi:hypothetical protein
MSHLTILDDITSPADGANDDGVCDAIVGSDTVSGRDGDDAIDVKDGFGRDTVDCAPQTTTISTVVPALTTSTFLTEMTSIPFAMVASLYAPIPAIV